MMVEFHPSQRQSDSISHTPETDSSQGCQHGIKGGNRQSSVGYPAEHSLIRLRKEPVSRTVVTPTQRNEE